MNIWNAIKNAHANIVDWVDDNPRKALWLAILIVVAAVLF